MKRLPTVIGLLLLSALPALAQTGPDAMLYELTEDVRLSATHRMASSALGGFANPNTLLCPAALVSASGRCVVNAIGSNNIAFATGRGPVHGNYTIVTQDINPFEIEELVRQRGAFRGEMDLSQTGVIFLGTMDGTMTVEQRRVNVPFRGIVRIPVPCGDGVFCYVTSGADGIPTGFVPLQSFEFALGRPAVRLDIYFQ